MYIDIQLKLYSTQYDINCQKKTYQKICIVDITHCENNKIYLFIDSGLVDFKIGLPNTTLFKVFLYLS